MPTQPPQNKILAAWDYNGDIRVQYRANGKSKNTTVQNFQWYFAIKYEDFARLDIDQIKQYSLSHIIKKLTRNGDYVKIYMDRDKKDILLGYLKGQGVQTYEADLSMYKRYMVDKEIPIETDITILFFDIETDDSHGGIEIGRDRIVSWAAYDQDGKSYYCYEGDDEDAEKRLLEKFFETLTKYDLFTGWNSTNFDTAYIKERQRKHNLQFEWRKKIHVDMMQRCIKLYSYDMDKIGLQGFSLKEVSRVFLHETKTDVAGMRTHEMEHAHPNLLKEYNLHDAELLYKLNKSLDIIPLMLKECEVTGTLMTHFYVGELLDNYMLRESKKLGMYLPTAPDVYGFEENKLVNIIGAYVHEPKTGLYDEVHVFDFSSLYPTIIVGWNIGQDALNVKLSHEGDAAFDVFVLVSKCCKDKIIETRETKIVNRTVDGEKVEKEVIKKHLICNKCGNDKAEYRKIEDVPFDEWFAFLQTEKIRLDPTDLYYQTANNNFFTRSKKSFIAGLVENLLTLRKTYKAEMKKYEPGSSEFGNARSMQAVIKELANSMFGVTGDKRSRYFNKGICEGITLTGQFLNKASSSILEDMGHTVIYGDTDSIFSPLPGLKDVEPTVEELNVKLKDFLTQNFKLQSYIISLDTDKKYKKMIMIDKKKYTGVLEEFGGQATTMKFSKGTEDIKKNTITFTRKKMSELILMITRDNKTLPEVVTWLEDVKKYFMETDELTAQDIAINVKISKGIQEYKSLPVHVQIAKDLIASGKMANPVATHRSWIAISYIITDGSGKNKAVHVDDFDGTWDRTHYWNVQFYAPIERMLKAAYPQVEWEQYEIVPPKKERKKRAKKGEKEDAVSYQGGLFD